jgi:hypothetical protein
LQATQSSSFLSFKVKHKVRREAIIIKLESSSPSSNYTSYFTDSHSNSYKEGEKEEEDSILVVAYATSLASSPDSISNNITV